MTTNESKCLLARSCKLAAGSECNDHCASYIALHGLTGEGGRIGTANLPKDYRLVTLKNSPVRDNQSNIYDIFDEYVKTFERQFDENPRRIKSIYLWSKSPGTGKTTTAAALLNEWIIKHYIGSIKRGKQPLQRPAYFLDVNEFQTEYNLVTMTNDESGISQVKSKIKLCQAVPFLVMDDLGVRGATDAFRSYIHAIINYRTVNGLPTVYTSNFEMAEMAKVFDERLYDRIRDQCVELHFDGTSRRGRR